MQVIDVDSGRLPQQVREDLESLLHHRPGGMMIPGPVQRNLKPFAVQSADEFPVLRLDEACPPDGPFGHRGQRPDRFRRPETEIRQQAIDPSRRVESAIVRVVENGESELFVARK
jgi:hypothetical protein